MHDKVLVEKEHKYVWLIGKFHIEISHYSWTKKETGNANIENLGVLVYNAVK